MIKKHDKFQMMKNYGESDKINHNPIWSYIPNHPYSVFIIGGTRSGKTNVLVNLIKHQWPDIEKICLYVKESFKSKYQLFINRRKKAGISCAKNSKAFIDYSQIIDNVYKNFIQQRKEKC